MSTNTDILEKAKSWASDSYFDQADREEIQSLIDANNMAELTERFYKELEFGTGGMRSILGMGNNRMNKYNVRKATQALSDVVLSEKKSDASVAISYDSRRFSFDFAKEVASVLAGNGIKAYIFKRLNPVSFLSFSIRHHKCTAGVMITASHNPPEYNGYKAFWSDGAQVIPPQDNSIITSYNTMKGYSSIKYLDFDQAEKDGFIHWVGEDIEDLFVSLLKEQMINPELCKEHGDKLNIVFTPIHGTGLNPVEKIFKAYGINNYTVIEEQKYPDSDFPTVTSPNPENPSALKMAVDKMLEINADFAAGTDPDCDRIGIAINQKGTPVYLNGNQLGTLMLHYILKNLKEQNRLPDNSYFVQSIVTTPLQEKIANDFGIGTERTLTGFKWICGRVRELEASSPEKNFLFGTEESFGYLNHPYARDKDGTGPMGLLAEMALFYKLQGKTLVDVMDDIYTEYGFSNEDLLNLVFEGKQGSEKIARAMVNFRARKNEDVLFEEIEVIEDYELQTVKNYITGEEKPITIAKSNVLGYKFKSGNILYLRPSGTEPKIKFYIMISESEGTLAEKKSKAHEKNSAILEFIKKEVEKA